MPLVRISMVRGRTHEERAGVRPEDVMITLSENGPEDWSFGNGVAQYVK
jgi:4-oxalocrotonate tautomerase